jgi:hypothetical protein
MESITVINRRLTDTYGKGDNVQSRFRVVWSHDQFEKQFTKYTDEGLELPYKILREVPKYRQWADNYYILESLTAVPEETNDALAAGEKLSYEPLWVFRDNIGNALPPKWEICQMIIESVLEAMSRTPGQVKYKMDEADYKTTEALMEKENKMLEALYGNESDISNALGRGEGVGYGSSERTRPVNSQIFDRKVN